MLTLYFDGLCEPCNPGGIACYGWLVLNEAGEIFGQGQGEVSRGDGATNNVAEYAALGFGLRWLADREYHGPLRIRGDSQLVIHQVAQRWACRSERLRPLRNRCIELLLAITDGDEDWDTEWIPREQNEAADRLSREAYAAATGGREVRR